MGITDNDSTDPSNFRNYQLHFHDKTLKINYFDCPSGINTAVQPGKFIVRFVEICDMIGIKDGALVDVGVPDADIYYIAAISFPDKENESSYSTCYIATDGEKYWSITYNSRHFHVTFQGMAHTHPATDADDEGWSVLRPRYLFGPDVQSFVIGAINVYQSCILKI